MGDWLNQGRSRGRWGRNAGGGMMLSEINGKKDKNQPHTPPPNQELKGKTYNQKGKRKGKEIGEGSNWTARRTSQLFRKEQYAVGNWRGKNQNGNLSFIKNIRT